MAQQKDDKAFRDALHEESLRLFPGTDDKSKKQRKGFRNQQRVDLGFKKEGRGGVAGFVDRNKSWIAPVASGLAGLATGGLLAPIAVGALSRGLDREGKGGIGFDVGQGIRGGLEGAAAGSVGKFANGLLSAPTQASFAASIPGAPTLQPVAAGIQATPGIAAPAASGGFSWGGAFDKAKDWALADGGRNALGALSGAYGVYQQAQGNEMMRDAAGRDAARWAEGAPLRAAGREGMLNPIAADTSSLDALAGIGNPFAKRPNPSPGAGTLAGNPDAERPGSQLRPIPASAMRGGR